MHIIWWRLIILPIFCICTYYANKALKLAIHVIMHCTPSIPVGINVPFPSGVPWALYLGTYTYGAKREAFKRKDFP